MEVAIVRRCTLVAVLLLMASAGITADLPPIYKVLTGPRTLEAQAGFWYALRSAVVAVGVDAQLLQFQWPDEQNIRRRMERLKLDKKKGQEPRTWHQIRVPPSHWPAVTEAFAGLMGPPKITEGDGGSTSYEATWVFMRPWRWEQYSFAVTLTGAHSSEPGTLAVVAKYRGR